MRSMTTKQELYDHLQKLQEENLLLRNENEMFRSTLLDIYTNTRSALGIEAAIQAREDELRKDINVSAVARSVS